MFKYIYDHSPTNLQILKDSLFIPPYQKSVIVVLYLKSSTTTKNVLHTSLRLLSLQNFRTFF